MEFRSFDEEYLVRLMEGDVPTEEHFARYFGELIHLKLCTRARSLQLIEDVRQETLTRVLRILRRDGLRACPARMRPRRMCRRICERHN